ncbi:unnamed protein product, partial [Staurois parvus]
MSCQSAPACFFGRSAENMFSPSLEICVLSPDSPAQSW